MSKQELHKKVSELLELEMEMRGDEDPHISFVHLCNFFDSSQLTEFVDFLESELKGE